MNKFLVLFLILLCKAEAQSSALLIADSLYAYGEYSKSVVAYKPFENKPDVAIKMAKAYLAVGDTDKALFYYKKAVNTSPNNLLYAYDYAKLLSRAQKLEEAKAVFETLILANVNNPNYHYELGVVKQKQKDSTYLNDFLKTIELDTQHLKAISKLGRYALSKRKYHEAIKKADKGLAIYKNSKELTSLKAQAYYWQEDYFHATQWFLKRLELGEPTQAIYEKLSYCYSRNYDHKNAIKYLKDALKFDPKNARNLYVIGKQYSLMEDFKTAERYYTLALELMDTPLHLEYLALASALNRQKKYKDAIQAYKKGLRHDPANKHIPFFLAHTKAQYYKDIDAKIKLYEDFIKKYPTSKLRSMAEHERDKLKEEKFMQGDRKR